MSFVRFCSPRVSQLNGSHSFAVFGLEKFNIKDCVCMRFRYAVIMTFKVVTCSLGPTAKDVSFLKIFEKYVPQLIKS